LITNIGEVGFHRREQEKQGNWQRILRANHNKGSFGKTVAVISDAIDTFKDCSAEKWLLIINP
jgi:hypothetical protein